MRQSSLSEHANLYILFNCSFQGLWSSSFGERKQEKIGRPNWKDIEEFKILTVYNGSTILISPRSKYKTYVRNHIKIDCFSACLICVHLYCLHYRPIKLCILLKHNSNIYRIMSYICSCLVYVTKLNNRIHFASEIPCNFTRYKIIFRLSWIMVTSWNLSLGNLQSHACLVFKAWKVESNSLVSIEVNFGTIKSNHYQYNTSGIIYSSLPPKIISFKPCLSPNLTITTKNK